MNAQATIAKPPARAARPARTKLRLAPPRSDSPVDDDPLPPIVPAAPTLFLLGCLRRADENVRHTNVDEDCDALADDIEAHGLLQSLIGYADGEHIEIVGGGRRLKALRIVRARGRIDDDFPVAVLIREVGEAVELSLAENLQQRTMSPVDEFFAFQELMKRGDTSPRELAKRFGWTERLVKQRLRLADLATPVIDALGKREITLDMAMAYASSQDKALQVEVFEHQAKRGRTAHEPAGVRHALRMKGIDTGDRLYKFVGADRYEGNGGDYEDDLFNEAGTERVLAQPFLLETLANFAIDLQSLKLVDELRRDQRWASTIAGAVKVPDLRLHAWGMSEKPRPPAGFVLVERTQHDRLWRTIRNNGFAVHIVVGLDAAGELIADPRYAFVPIAQKTAVEKPSLVDVAENTAAIERERARMSATEREIAIMTWSRRYAVPSVEGTQFQGRVFWPPIDQDRARPETIDGVQGWLVPSFIFVPQDDVAAARRDAITRVDRDRSAENAGGTRPGASA